MSINNNEKIKEEKASQSISSSLRFPSSTLENCLEKIKIIFEKNAKNAISSEAMVADLGFSSKNGASDSLLSSMKYYGLLVKTNTNKYKIADFVLDYCISNTLKHDILFTCLMSVPINRKLFSIYDFKNLPSENEIKVFLIKECGYNLKQATSYIDTFSKNKKLYYDNTSDILSKDESVTNEQEYNVEKPSENIPNTIIKSSNSNATISYPLSGDKNILIQLPREIKELDSNDLEDIKDILELVLKKITKQLEKLIKE